MRVDCGQLNPGAVIRQVPGEWHPRMPERLDEEELAGWPQRGLSARRPDHRRAPRRRRRISRISCSPGPSTGIPALTMAARARTQVFGALAAQFLHARPDLGEVVSGAGPGTLAAQLLHARPDHRKIVSGAGCGSRFLRFRVSLM
jgi:hypothetical protein